jgi:phage repressor protein C with HTH and peptisase S24 domain
MSDNELRTRIQNRLTELGRSPITAAVGVGLERTYIRDFVNGRKDSIRLDKRALVAQALDWSVEQLMNEGARGAPLAATVAGDRLVGAHDFPIYAAAQGGNGHMIVHTDVMEYVKRPVILEGVPNAYGILIVGDSMVPAYREGDMALIHPRRPPERDTDVVLYDQDHRTGEAKSMIKRLVGFNDRSWKLEQYNPAKTFSEHRADWPICHQVVGMYKGRR